MANIFVPTPINLSGPWNIAREDCIGDSLGYINANTNYLAYTIETLSATTFSRINSLSGETINSNVGAVVIFQDQRPQNTNAGGSVAATWNTRIINTKVIDTNNLCSNPVSNTFTLPAGTWNIEASAPAYITLRHRLRLFNTSQSTVAALGTSEYAHINATYGAFIYNRSFLRTVIELTSPRTFRIDHYTERAQAGNGLGVPVNAGGVEIYTEVTCRKIK
jgi:hypothetical protein